MDSFSVLSDDLLIKILSLVPTKVAVSTSILSKRWEYLWRWLPKLQFSCPNSPPYICERLHCFLDRNLPLHRAPVIESLYLQLCSSHFKPDRIKLWIVAAISHSLRELEVLYAPINPDLLPRNLFTCKSLVILKLDGDIDLDVPEMVFLPSLKTLHFKSMRYFYEESLRLILSNCPILEDLLLGLEEAFVMGELTVVAPTLQSLSLYLSYLYPIGGGIVIKTPSLKYFKLVDLYMQNHYCLIENMPNLIKAYIDVELSNIKSLFGSLTSVKHLAICSGVMYDEDFVFNQLRHLEVCKGNNHWLDLLVRLLKGSPNLQVLDISRLRGHYHNNEVVYWNEPSTIPKCLLSSLQTFNWEGYIRGERDVVVYIMKNASHLRTTTIKYNQWAVPDFETRKELELSSRTSSTFQFVFEPVVDG